MENTNDCIKIQLFYLLEVLKNVQSVHCYLHHIPVTSTICLAPSNIQVKYDSRVLLDIPTKNFQVLNLGEQFWKKSSSVEGLLTMELKLGLVISAEQRQASLENEYLEDMESFINLEHIQQLCCKICASSVLDSSSCSIKRVISTPSTNWLEMTDMWICTCCNSGSHSHNHSHKHHRVAANSSAFGMYR